MVPHAALPIAKLGALLLKQVSKPIANILKQQAKNSPVFRKYVCLPPARFYNWCEVKIKMWLLSVGQPVNITVLNDTAASNLGADLLGESIIFLIAAGILVSEYNRSARKDAAKEEAKQKETEELRRTLTELFMQTEEHGAHIRELSRIVGELETRVIQKPWAPKKSPSEPEPPPSREPPPFIKPLLPRVEESYADEKRNEAEEKNEAGRNVDNMRLVENFSNDVKELHSTNGFLLRAINCVESEFWNVPEKKRESGIISAALNQLYRDVYRIPLKF